MKRLNVLTSSSVSCYRSCPRKYKLRYIDQLVSTSEAGALRFGSRFHDWREAWMKRSPGAEPLTPTDHDTAKLNALTIGYAARWADWRDRISVIGVEQQFESPLTNPETGKASTYWTLAGKLDAILMIDGRATIDELKTTSDSLDVGSGYFERLRINSQLSIYHAAFGALGISDQTPDLLYDVAKKPLLRPKSATKEVKHNKDGSVSKGQQLTDETPAEFQARCLESISENFEGTYQHFAVTRMADEVEQSAMDLWFTAATMRESVNSGRFPRNPDACYNYNSFCQYWPMCSGVASADDATRFQHKPAHSELTL
jgi:hypothetical protein